MANGPRSLGPAGTFRLEPPRLRTINEAGGERHATWFELYFDLVFVAAASQLGTGLARNLSAAGFARFAALSVPIVWAWIVYALYANRFDTDDLVFRLAKAGGMLAIAAVTVNVHPLMDGHGGSVGFALAYVVLRGFLIGLYIRARLHVRGRARRLCEVYIVGYSSTTALWLASVFVPTPGRFVLWGVAMAIDLVIPTHAWAVIKGASIVVSHLTERFGTFFIIVLGESVVAVVAGVADIDFTLQSWLVAGICFVIALCLWWVYFDLADTSVVGRGVLGLVFVYAHFPLLAGVGVFGDGTRLAIEQASEPGLSAAARWALAGGIAAFALSLAIIHVGAEWTSLRDRACLGRLAVAAIAITLAAAGGAIAPLAFVALIGAVVLGQLLLEAFTPRTGAASAWAPRLPEAEAAPHPNAAAPW
ncbi:MAG TPA: low temperature requirement protein A [Conexibacter sp.]